MDNDLSYTYLSSLNKDELIQLLLTINNETIKDKKQFLRECVLNNGYTHNYQWLAVCDTYRCLTLMCLYDEYENHGYTCSDCSENFCENCKFDGIQCSECNNIFCKNCFETLNADKGVCKSCAIYINPKAILN